MPRIDPLQLLKCLGVLLTNQGGIRSKEEVQRLASLMMKFSKKLVSKCVYILILKNTDTELLGMFMSSGGWTLIFTWLSDGICGKNWALVSELLELLLMCPVDVERLKSNSIPRLVKGLSKDESLGGVNVLATKLVEQWLKIVKDETVPDKEVAAPIVEKPIEVVVQVPMETTPVTSVTTESVAEVTVTDTSTTTVVETVDAQSQSPAEISPQSFYKLTVRDGKQVIAKVDTVTTETTPTLGEEVVSEVIEVKEKNEVDDKKNNKDKSKHDKSKHRSSSSSSSSSKNSNSSSSSKDKRSSSRDRDKHRDRDKNRDRKNRDREHRSNGSMKSSSSSSSSSSNKDNNNKDKQAEKDKATLAKIQPQSVEKLGRIPKKSSSSSDKSKSEKKTDDHSSVHKSKPSISIEVRKKDGDRPKTVKVFNSKLRSTGLEEMAKPPPPRVGSKKSVALPPVIPMKRPSPSREAVPPPEKKIKLPDPEERQDKAGGIKLIPPKPKPAFLQESDMFMDALTASATNKKEPKKRKRRTSVTKENANNSAAASPPTSPSVTGSGISPLSSPIALKSITAPKFYKDTLETDEPKTADSEPTKTEPQEAKEASTEDAEVKEEEGPTENVVKEVNGLRGVLVYHKRKGVKKCVKWRVDSELEEVQYFELDETERVNVTKTFTDMKQMEHVGEREALQLSRKLPNEDLMDERTTWRPLVVIDLPAPLAESGKKSSEKAIQFAREKGILQALYFSKSMLPDSAAEPDVEHHQMTDPAVIPLDDVTGNPDSINDYQNTPWPEPKGSPPHKSPVPSMPPNLFPAVPQFPPAHPIPPPTFPAIPQQFPGPGFPGHNIMAGDWRGMNDAPVIPPDVINHGPVNPNMYNNRQDGYNNMMDDNNFPPQNFGPGPGPMHGPMYQGFGGGNRGNNRGGGFRNMNRGGWFRPSGPPPGWHGPRGGSGNHWGGRGGAICKQYKMHGYCRNRDACPFMHPPGNGPY